MYENEEFDEIEREHIGDLKYLGELLGFLRFEKGLSQRQVALYADISNTELHRIEKGERQKPSPKILKKLSEILDIQYESLLQYAGYLDLQDDVSTNVKLNYNLLSDEEKDYILDYLCEKWNREAPKSTNKKYTKQEISNMLFDKTIMKPKTEEPQEDDFKFAYHKETEGLSDEEIKEALEFYKKIKYGKENKKEK